MHLVCASPRRVGLVGVGEVDVRGRSLMRRTFAFDFGAPSPPIQRRAFFVTRTRGVTGLDALPKYAAFEFPVELDWSKPSDTQQSDSQNGAEWQFRHNRNAQTFDCSEGRERKFALRGEVTQSALGGHPKRSNWMRGVARFDRSSVPCGTVCSSNRRRRGFRPRSGDACPRCP